MSEYGYIPEGPEQSAFNNKGIFSPKDIYNLDRADKWTPQLGQLELIETQTVSGAVAGVDFTNLGDYNVHFITTHSFSSATDFGSLGLRVSTDSGSSFKTSSYQYANQYANVGNFGEQKSTSTDMIRQMTAPNSGSSPFASNGYAYLYNFLDSGKFSFVTWHSTSVISFNSNYEGYFGSGVYPVAETHNAFRLMTTNSSNVDNGTISLYGIRYS
jgi:hypothetical protein